MNKLLLAISIASLSLVGCSTHKEATAAPTVNEMQYGVKIFKSIQLLIQIFLLKLKPNIKPQNYMVQLHLS